MNTVTYQRKSIDLDAARALMDGDFCDKIHGTVKSEQEFMDVYVEAHENKYRDTFVFA